MRSIQIPDYNLAVNGLNILYKRFGQGPPLILIHGGSNDWHEWQINIPFLAKEFCVYAPDLPGFGLSDSSGPLSLSRMTSFLSDFMKELGITRASVIGHSLGGMIALALALDYPEKVNKIVLVNSAGLGGLSTAGRLLMSAFRGIKKVMGKNREPEYEESTIQDWILVNRLPELKAPVMIIWGEWDPYLSISQAKAAQSLIPDCQLYPFRRCRHAPHRENPEKFHNLVSQFLQK